VVLQSYIDFEISEGNRENTRKLYERLLQRTKHVKVCCSHNKTQLFICKACLGQQQQALTSAPLAMAQIVVDPCCEAELHTALSNCPCIMQLYPFESHSKGYYHGKADERHC